MTNLGGEFDAERIDPAQPFDTIPSGKYLVELVDSDKRLTKNGKGQYLWLEFQILDGDHAGRKLWDRLNLWNENKQAVEIAERTFSALCHAAGKLRVSDSIELHNIPVVATVRFRPATEAQEARDGKPATPAYEASNEIRGYTAAGGRTAPMQSGKMPPPSVAPTSPAAAPWKTSQRRP